MSQGIEVEPVSRWLSTHVEGFKGPATFELIAGGRSNLTYRCEDANGVMRVLRRPPLGHVLQSAHDVAREHRIISALNGSTVPVPECLGLCEDLSVNDAPFCVFEFVSGDVLHTAEDAQVLSADARLSLSRDVAEVLARLHMIDPDTVGLGTLGRKEAYLERQLKRWSRQWGASKTHAIPAMDETFRLLNERLPQQIGATIVHGDYRLGNMIVREGRIHALLDWELCTLGDPLADVGYLLNSWEDAAADSVDLARVPASAAGGFMDQGSMCEIYQTLTGRNLDDIAYYRAFSHWRLAAIGQGVYKRYLMGAMGDEVDLEVYKASVSERANLALALFT